MLLLHRSLGLDLDDAGVVADDGDVIATELVDRVHDADRGTLVAAEEAGLYEKQVPAGRGCRVIDVARAIFYVVEQEYETGQAIPVTGGQEMLK